jgi:hypothetical protein
MDVETEMEREEGLTPHALRRRERDALLRAAGIRPAPGKWPPPEFETLKPRFYSLRRLWWPIRRYLRRLL